MVGIKQAREGMKTDEEQRERRRVDKHHTYIAVFHILYVRASYTHGKHRHKYTSTCITMRAFIHKCRHVHTYVMGAHAVTLDLRHVGVTPGWCLHYSHYSCV